MNNRLDVICHLDPRSHLTCLRALVVALIVSGTSVTGAAVITFDSISEGSYSPGTTIGTEAGYTLTAAPSGTGNLLVGTPYSPTGNGIAQESWPESPILQITQATIPFAFVGFDISDQLDGFPAAPVAVRGYLGGVLQATDVYDPDSPPMATLAAVNLAGVTIDELQIEMPINEFAYVNIDNVELIPEPSSATLISCAFALPLFYRRRRLFRQ